MRYVVHPGWVLSRYDNQEHYITSNQLIDLYRIRGKKILVMYDPWPWPKTYYYRPLPGDIHLYPKYNGNYESMVEE